MTKKEKEQLKAWIDEVNEGKCNSNRLPMIQQNSVPGPHDTILAPVDITQTMEPLELNIEVGSIENIIVLNNGEGKIPSRIYDKRENQR